MAPPPGSCRHSSQPAQPPCPLLGRRSPSRLRRPKSAQLRPAQDTQCRLAVGPKCQATCPVTNAACGSDLGTADIVMSHSRACSKKPWQLTQPQSLQPPSESCPQLLLSFQPAGLKANFAKRNAQKAPAQRARFGGFGHPACI